MTLTERGKEKSRESAEVSVSLIQGLVADARWEVGYVETPVGFFVGWIDVSWHDGPGSPKAWLRGVTHVPDVEDRTLEEELERARKKRKRAMRSCRYCGETNIPGHMHSKDVCRGCAERELGVVH